MHNLSSDLFKKVSGDVEGVRDNLWIDGRSVVVRFRRLSSFSLLVRALSVHLFRC